MIVRIVLFLLTLSAFLGSAVFAWVAFVEKNSTDYALFWSLNFRCKTLFTR